LRKELRMFWRQSGGIWAPLAVRYVRRLSGLDESEVSEPVLDPGLLSFETPASDVVSSEACPSEDLVGVGGFDVSSQKEENISR
jgi:hypothetical protein